MKALKRIIAAVGFFMMMMGSSHAQNYYRGEQILIQPLQVMIENYKAITLGKEIANEPGANRFDKFNPYTYLQLIHDNMGMDYHVLFQSNFSGKVLFLAYSNNLSALINNADKPQNVFLNCIKRVNDHLSSVQNTEAAITCIIERLNYCSN